MSTTSPSHSRWDSIQREHARRSTTPQPGRPFAVVIGPVGASPRRLRRMRACVAAVHLGAAVR